MSYYARPTPHIPAVHGPYVDYELEREFNPYTSLPPTAPTYYDRPQASRLIDGAALLHSGFYQILSMIPTPTNPSRLIWGAWNQSGSVTTTSSVVPGPRYEDISHSGPNPIIFNEPIKPLTADAKQPQKYKKITKELISSPTGFRHLVHAADAAQAEELLTRWGPDGVGKLGDPLWAGPIIERMRQRMAINNVVNAIPQQSPQYGGVPQLRVVNGLSAITDSALTSDAQEDLRLAQMDGLPSDKSPTTPFKWDASGVPQEHHTHQETFMEKSDIVQVFPPPKPIVPSLQTIERAVAARIFFENLYFPILRQSAPREQRRVAMEKDMMALRLSEAHKDELRARWRQNESDYLRDKRRKIDATSFVKLKTIGHGAFGVVSLVRERPTGQLFAMKELRKTDMLRKGQEGHVRAERDVLRSASLVNSPGAGDWIVRMFYSFQDRDHLYLILEYMGGGDLLNLLIERDTFEEDFTRFYVAEMILAIEACHKLGYIHRDIKPDNFLFDPNGHLKLSDFGLATDLHWAHDTSYYEQQRKQLLKKHGVDLQDPLGIADTKKTKRMNKKDVDLIMGNGVPGEGVFTWREKHSRRLAYSVCGTNSYMSPEVIRGYGYTFSCDWWSLGVIMFECLYGYPPFVSNSRQITRQKILNHKQSLKFPPKPRVSHEAIDLMHQLLSEPEDRLGSQSTASSRPNSIVVNARRSAFVHLPGSQGSLDGADIIKTHPWFRGVDWLNIHRYPPPYRPELSFPGDTRHFDSDIPAEPLAPANGAPADATKDPMLNDRVHGAEILDVRKDLAFKGFTHKSPRVISYVKADNVFVDQPSAKKHGTVRNKHSRVPPAIPPSHDVDERGRSTVRGYATVGSGRALSL